MTSTVVTLKSGEVGYFWHFGQSPDVFQRTLTRIDDMLKVAAKYDGRVFGGYVRGVLMPLTLGRKIDGFKDVDLWFKNKQDAEKFVDEMADKLRPRRISSIGINGEVVYLFDRTQYYLIGDEESGSSIIDVIVSETLPVDDLDVNQLTYSAEHGYESYGEESVQLLEGAIKQKFAKMLPGFSRQEMSSERWCHQQRRLQKLHRLGWSIFANDGTVLY